MEEEDCALDGRRRGRTRLAWAGFSFIFKITGNNEYDYVFCQPIEAAVRATAKIRRTTSPSFASTFFFGLHNNPITFKSTSAHNTNYTNYTDRE